MVVGGPAFCRMAWPIDSIQELEGWSWRLIDSYEKLGNLESEHLSCLIAFSFSQKSIRLTIGVIVRKSNHISRPLLVWEIDQHRRPQVPLVRL